VQKKENILDIQKTKRIKDLVEQKIKEEERRKSNA
tara:strand:- start:241 stop:345 length:105 start_codon:yes stop_codon:yes gene_type:complete